MKARERIVPFLIVLGAIGLGISGCNTDRLDSGSQSLGVVFAPSPAGLGRFERGAMTFELVRALAVDPLAKQVFGTELLQLRFGKFPDAAEQDTYPNGVLGLTQPVAFSSIALTQGTYALTHIVITHPALNTNNIPNPVPTDPASCMLGVASVSADTVGAPGKVVFDDPNGLKLFTVHPGQSTLSLKLNIPAFLAAYETQFTCQVGCGTNDPTKNCVIAPFNESAFRSAFLANLTIE